jgi:hypothetical protein
VAALGAASELTAGCTALSDIEKVLAFLSSPSIEGIANSILSIISAFDPPLAVPVQAALVLIEAGFQTADQIILAYESNINGIPQSVLADLDAAVAAINANIAKIEAEIPNMSAIVKAGINVGLDALQTILGFLASIIPAATAAAMFPKSYSALSARGIRFGVTAYIPTTRAFAQDYNSKMDAAGFKHAHIHVPWFSIGKVPIFP